MFDSKYVQGPYRTYKNSILYLDYEKLKYKLILLYTEVTAV